MSETNLGTGLRIGAENLLVTCGGLRAGDTLLILQEDPKHGYYSQCITDAVVSAAKALGVETTCTVIDFDPIGGDLPPEQISAMRAANRTLFLSRRGDQIRFSQDIGGIRPIMSYALDAAMLASGFGGANYTGFVALKDAVNALFLQAGRIRVTCPLGSDFSGPGANFPKTGADVTVDRFPMSVFAPVPATGFSGVVMQEGFLVGTGSKYYHPYGCALRSPLAIHFDGKTLTHFEGQTDDIVSAREHFHRVGREFGLDPFTMHSWHAGIHPGCAYTRPAAENYERWSGAAFGNPRLLHFHTCGNYAPGEISLNVLDPTISVDGVDVWSNGVLQPYHIPGGADILEEYPCIKAVFETPARQVGQGRKGRLCADGVG